MQSLDAIDRRILNRLRLDARITNQALASEVGLSPSACLRRVRLLEQSGVIRGYAAIVSHAAPHEGTTAIVQIELERQTEEYLVRFEKAVRDHAEMLKDRARRIVNMVTGLDYDAADELLKKSKWDVKAAIVMQKTGSTYAGALKKLRQADDSVREALGGEDIEPRLKELLGLP